MATQKDLLGGTTTVRDEAVAVDIRRYNELIKKEALFDELIKSNDVLVLLNPRLALKEENGWSASC